MIGRLQDMLDRLQHAIPDVERLPLREQEELAAQIETLLGQLERRRPVQTAQPQTWRDLAGAWSDLPDTVDEMFAELDRIRHANPPSSPLELP